MSQDGPNGKWHWVLKGYRWRVITTSPFDDSTIIDNVPCKMAADIKTAFEGAIKGTAQGGHIYLVQWEERARFGSQEWERVARWDGRQKKVRLLGAPALEENVKQALSTVDPSPVLS